VTGVPPILQTAHLRHLGSPLKVRFSKRVTGGSTERGRVHRLPQHPSIPADQLPRQGAGPAQLAESPSVDGVPFAGENTGQYFSNSGYQPL